MIRTSHGNEWLWAGKIHIVGATLLSGLFLTVVGVAQPSQEHAHHGDMPPAKAVTKAVAVISPLGSSGVQGTVTFTQEKDGIRVNAHLTGLTTGKYGFHVHEYGDCSSSDGQSAGGHFNPSNQKHGAPMDMERHEGDLGNIEVSDAGIGETNFVDTRLSFTGPNSILGRSVVVHRNADDLTTQPSGNSGPRIGCGVIGVAMPDTVGTSPKK